MPPKPRKGDIVLCTHYKRKYLGFVTGVRVKQNEVWIKQLIPSKRYFDGFGFNEWYGPKEWFKVVYRVS